MSETDANTQVSHEVNGRTLSGMGASPDQLEAVMERHAPEEPASSGTAGTPTTAEGGAEPPAPHPTRGQKRFAELTAERDAAKAEAATAKAEREALARERDELKARTPAPAAETPKPAATEPPKDFDFPDYETYLSEHPDTTYDAWRRKELAAFAAWDREQNNVESVVAKALESDRARRSLDDKVASSRAKGREAYADFDTVLKSGPGASVNLGPTPEQAQRRCAMIFQHPQSEHLQYAIMKDGDLAARLGAMDDISFGMEIAKLTTPATKPQERRVTPPPAPYQPVNGNSATTPTPSAELAGKGFDFDKSGYREKRAAERKLTRAR